MKGTYFYIQYHREKRGFQGDHLCSISTIYHEMPANCMVRKVSVAMIGGGILSPGITALQAEKKVFLFNFLLVILHLAETNRFLDS